LTRNANTKLFRSVRAAKEFLVEKIVAEAEHESVPLSEVEWKMLYFSETGWTLPDMAEVNEKFDAEYDQCEYEDRARALVNSYLKHADGGERTNWDEAVKTLREGDHYLLVVIGQSRAKRGGLNAWVPQSSLEFSRHGSKRPTGDLLRLWVVALALLAGTLIVWYVLYRFFGPGSR
jgi:hypothetical protein